MADMDRWRIRPESNRKPCRASHLEILMGGKSLIHHRIHPVIGIGRIHKFADKRQVGGFGKHIVRGILSMDPKGEAQ